MRTFWSSDSMLMTDKYYWSSTIWDTNSAWAFELNTGRITNQNKKFSPSSCESCCFRIVLT